MTKILSFEEADALAKKNLMYEEEQEGSTNPKPHNENGGGNISQATLLVRIAEQRCELFCDYEQKAYATIQFPEHAETWPIRRRSFKHYLCREFYFEHKKSPSSQAVHDALGVIEGMALYNGKKREVFTRLGGRDDEVYLDLGTEEWTMAKVTETGWEIVQHGDIKFRRSSGMKPLPTPIGGGNLSQLLNSLIPLDEEKLILCSGFMVSLMRYIGAQFILDSQGEQGSGKTTFNDVIKSSIDPNAGGRRTQPRDERDLMICAANNWVVSLDNLSGVPAWLSDGLCRLSTGGALATRTLYSDDEETLFEAQRPVLLNGIGGVASRPDLLDRIITITLPTIPESKRRSEREFWRAHHKIAGDILGALLDATVIALRNIKMLHLPEVERMADAVLWVTAAEPALGWEPGTFQRTYRANRLVSNETALESNLIYEPMQDLLSKPFNRPWNGMPSKLLEELSTLAGDKVKDKNWPRNARALRNALQRIAPNLRAEGIGVEFRKRTEKGSMVTLDYLGDRHTGHTGHTEPDGNGHEPVCPGGAVGPKHSYSREAHLDI